MSSRVVVVAIPASYDRAGRQRPAYDEITRISHDWADEQLVSGLVLSSVGGSPRHSEDGGHLGT